MPRQGYPRLGCQTLLYGPREHCCDGHHVAVQRGPGFDFGAALDFENLLPQMVQPHEYQRRLGGEFRAASVHQVRVNLFKREVPDHRQPGREPLAARAITARVLGHVAIYQLVHRECPRSFGKRLKALPHVVRNCAGSRLFAFFNQLGHVHSPFSAENRRTIGVRE